MPWLIAVGGTVSTAQAELAEELAGLVGVTRARMAPPEAELPGEVCVVALRTEGSDESRDVLRELLPDGRLLEVHRGDVVRGDRAVAAAAGSNCPLWNPCSGRSGFFAASAIPGRGPRRGRPRGTRWRWRPGARGVSRSCRRVKWMCTSCCWPGRRTGCGRPLRRRVLGPLLEYDAEQHTDLVHTVRVFLECSGSPTRAAKALHVHVNTLRYRIGRAGELLGADLTEFTDQLDVYLALRAGDQPEMRRGPEITSARQAADDARVLAFGRLQGAANRLEYLLGRALERECGITHLMYEVLLIVGRAGADGLTMRSIAQEQVLTTGGATRLVDRMEALGLVTRTASPSDGGSSSCG